MLPLQQAREVTQSIREYIRATFAFGNETVERAFYNFIEDPNHGMIKGPYVSLRTPFVSAPEDAKIPLEISPKFTPHMHQMEAFGRLTCRDGHAPEPILLTTGTGSGKTEAFEFPILDYCWQNRHRRGIKVIILYPMNALATDQAKRLAADIWNDDRLKGEIRAGLFIGKGKQNMHLPQTMGAENIIEDRDTIVDSAPDILLTNFKMLDMGLMQNQYARLWQYNLEDPELLKFIVLDELHTYDGAQGTDVANLLRRLKLRLNMPDGHLCPVGTSATLGSGEDAKEKLCRYASDIFGEKISPQSVIGEHRLSARQLFAGEPEDYMPTITAIRKMRIREQEDYNTYIDTQKKLWRIQANNQVELGDRLNEITIVRDLVEVCENRGSLHVQTLINLLAAKNDDFANLPETDGDLNPRMVVLESLLALIAEAKRRVVNSTRTMPYLFLQVQLWVRELSGIRRVVNDIPEFTWRDENVAADSDKVFLPAWFCRDCGASGWYMLKNEHDDKFVTGETETIQAVANHDKRIYLVYPVGEGDLAEDYKNNAGYPRHIWIDPTSLEISAESVPGFIECHAVRQIETQGNHDRWINVCPECNDTNDSISMIGTQVATLGSLSVGQLLSSNLENAPQRKILAFTNGVQDASHDASFFEARNFRFMFRTATQKVVGLYDAPVSLGELSKRFVDYWKNEEPGYDVDKYVYTFYPTDLEGRYPLMGQNRDDAFIREFDLRMTWQITQEYGYGAFIGRTLEKTGSSATFFKEEELREAYRLMLPWLEANRRQNITEEKFIRFLNLVLHRMRLRGAIDHPYLQTYRKEPGWYKLNRPEGHWLNRTFGGKQRWPLMTVTGARDEKLRNAMDSTYRRNDRAPINWYHSFYECNFTTSEVLKEEYAQLINEFYARLFEVLTQLGIVSAVTGKEGTNYAINPDHLFISRKVKHIRCGECRNQIRVAEEDSLVKESCCMGHLCHGQYTLEEPLQLNYYHNVYHRNHIPRVFAHEHNGMLDRKKREEIEDSFIRQESPNSINTLVATSTLEMGIDIGDLNCGINISVPPTVANFAQRVGRAGRKTGASLIVNFSKRDKPHDLFYFAEPLEMMNGDVSTPGCYLEAKEILARHFYAFCIDSWGAADKGNTIPALMKLIPAGGNFIPNPEFFINRLHKWILDNFTAITDRFASQYEGDVKNVILPDLFRSFFGGLYFNTVEKAFERLNKEYRGINADIEYIRQEIASRRLAKTDPEYKELTQQIALLRRRREGIDDMTVLEFMTDSGLLPNYAFPETGVKLSATVRSDNQGGTPIPDDEFEVVRPASQGIKELAPGNVFFARHYRLEVDGLVTTDWNDTDAVGEKRFCSECDYMEDEHPGHANLCPKCGSPTFGAASNVHKFVRLESVRSWMRRKDAMADDRKDDRDSHFYRMSNHFKFNEDNAVSYAMTEIPFGIQYVKNVELTDVNLGDAQVMTAQNLNINGRENVQRHGFIVCRHCGKAVNDPAAVRREDNANKRMHQWHYPFCKQKDKEYEDGPDEVFEETYLYRSFSTEAIKVLLPVGEIDTKAQVAMFKAGLMLGMRDFFGGEPSHIQIRDYREMNMATGKWDNYLVMFDTIPGGSGYLAKLVRTENFTRLLKYAYERIRDCECQHSGKDGCYHCILTYGNQFEQKNLSREKAEDLFRSIIEKSDKWETVNGTLGRINTTGGIEESELEERFIRTLKRYVKDYNGKLEVSTAFGTKLYTMTIGARQWIVQPQYTLDSSKGVKFYTIADFLISEVNSSNKPLAIYLDGYRYHGASINGGTPRFFHDVEQRNSIVNSNRFIPWTLTWEDLDLKDTTNRNQTHNDSLYRTGNDQTKRIVKEIYGRNSHLAECLNSFDRMMYVLLNTDKYPEEVATLLVEYNTDLRKSMHHGSEIDAYFASGSPEYKFTVHLTPDNFFFTSSAPKQALWLRTLITIPSKPITAVRYQVNTDLINQDLEKDIWNHYWRLQNLLGLLGSNAIYSCCSGGIEPSVNTSSGLSLAELIEAYDNEELNPMIELLHANGVQINSDGYFAIEENGEIVADALLGSEEYKFAVTDDVSSCTVLKSRGYTILAPYDIETLKNIIQK